MVGLAIRGHINTAIQILKDKLNNKNIDIALEEFKDFCTNKETGIFNENELGINTKNIYEMLLEIKKKNKRI